MGKKRTFSFTGLCFFVPHRNEDAVSVYLSNATTERTGTDGKPLRPHLARIVHTDARGNRCRYEFDLAGTRLSLGTANPPDADRRSVIDCHELVRMESVYSGHPMRRRTKGDSPHPVLGWFELRTGRLQRGETGSGWEWGIANRVPGRTSAPASMGYAWMIHWEAEIDTLPNLRLTPDKESQGFGTPTTLRELDPENIEIWNARRQHLPAPGPGAPGNHHRPNVGDQHEDFRWFYELVENKGDLPTSLPVPVLSRRPQLHHHHEKASEAVPAIDTHDCLPAQGDCGFDP